MNLDEVQLRQLFFEVSSVIYRSENDQLAVNMAIILSETEQGGRHRVALMDALRSAVNGVDTVTPEDEIASAPWYMDTNRFIEVASMAVSQFNRN